MTFSRLALLALGLLAACTKPLEFAAAPPYAVQTLDVDAYRDVSYYAGPGHDAERHVLDVFVPRGKRDFPVLFFVHGGGWISGRKDSAYLDVYNRTGPYFASRGIAVVMTNYRLAPDVDNADQVRDVARAFAWTVANLPRLGARADRIVLSGHSAGAHLASLVGSDERHLAEVGLSLKNVRAVLPVSGIYEVLELGLPFDELFLAGVFGKSRDRRMAHSPIMHLRKNLPPFFVLSCDEEWFNIDRQTATFVSALRESGVTHKHRLVTGRNHLTIVSKANSPGDPAGEAIVSYMLSL